jgi:plastocyanin
MRFRVISALSLGVAVLIATAPPPANACHWWGHGGRGYAPTRPIYYPSAPMYRAAPTYSAPGAYYAPQPGVRYTLPGMATPTAPTQPTTATTVSARDNMFEPPTLNVRPGTTVRWTNNGQHPHTVTDRGGKFDSGDIAPGASYTVTFQSAGTYRFYCKHHKGMEGTIVVGDAGPSPAGSGGGSKGTGY